MTEGSSEQSKSLSKKKKVKKNIKSCINLSKDQMDKVKYKCQSQLPAPCSLTCSYLLYVRTVVQSCPVTSASQRFWKDLF